MLYKVTNNSATLKALASVRAGENHFVKPDTTKELDLRPLSHDQLKKYAAADLLCELLGEASMSAPEPVVTSAELPPQEPVVEPVVEPVADPAIPAPEPWQKGLEPPK